jgi:hypothetical protein
MKRHLAAAALMLLAAPAAAQAHPGVYTVTQKVLEASDTCRLPDDTCLANNTRTQYAVGNDGWANSFTEGNNAPAKRGLLNYKDLPGTWRGNASGRTALLNYVSTNPSGFGATNLQAHATCLGGSWDTPANILAWQEDPFFNYIPWQKTSAGLGDTPEEWIPLVKALTTVDLNTLDTVDQFRSMCQTIGGTYYPADLASSITTAQLSAATTPLQSQITTLQNSLAPLQAAKTTLEAQYAAAETARQQLVARPLTLALSASRFAQGAAMVTGPANSGGTVRMRVSSAVARRLGSSTTIMTRTVTLGSEGAALVNLVPKSSVARALRKSGRAQKVTIEVSLGGQTKTAAGSIDL